MGRRYPVTFEKVSVSALQDLLQIKGAVSSVAVAAAVSAGGSGYVVGDTIILAGGLFTLPVVLTVLTLSGSAVATVSIKRRGNYTTTPANAVAQGSTSGAGTGATFTMTWGTVSKQLKIIRQWLTCSQAASLPSPQILSLRARWLGATVTDGTGGAAATIGMSDQGDAPETFAALANNTTKASTTGASKIEYEGGMHLFGPHEQMYSNPHPINAGESFVFELLDAPMTGPVVMSGGVLVEETG